MQDLEQKFPQLRLFSLPSIADNGDRTIEMGEEGQPKEAAKGLDALIQEAESRQHLYEIL